MNKSIFIFILSLFGIYTSQAATFSVGSGQTYTTISAAVAVANTGDTIEVHAGTYREAVTISKSGITFKPYGNDVVTLNGCDVLTGWISDGNGVYHTTMNWDVTEMAQSNQVFVDGRMLNLTRWPHLTSKDSDGEYDRMYAPENARVKTVTASGSTYTFTPVMPFASAQEAAMWNGAQIWINLSSQRSTGLDGQGWTGTVSGTTSTTVSANGCGNHGIGDQPWQLGPTQEFYVFNPIAASVNANGGITALLAEGEWWKTGTTLYVKLPGGAAPGEAGETSNVIEAKRRVFSFAPTNLARTMSGITIKGFKLFATSITTDLDAPVRTNVAASTSNIFDGLDVKYVTHFTNQTGDFQIQWSSQSGIILSGKNNIVKNCKFQYSAGSGVSVIGEKNKVLNNFFIDMNYSVAQAGAINTGKWNQVCYDVEIAYNTIQNVCNQATNMSKFTNKNPAIPGVGRFHHNKITNFMIRASDSGGFDVAGIDAGWPRLDHNDISVATNPLAIGIYIDFGGQYIMDHNLIWNVDRPIQLNQNGNDVVGWSPIRVYNNTATSNLASKLGIQNGVASWGPTFDIRNNIASGTSLTGGSGSGPVINHNLNFTTDAAKSNLFADVLADDYSLKPTASTAIDKGVFVPYADSVQNIPDLGCYEFGVPQWEAGYGKIKPEFELIDTVSTFKIDSQAHTYTIQVYAVGFSEFAGKTVILGLGTMPAGVSASLSNGSVNMDSFVTLTINTTAELNKDAVFTLTGTSGIYSYTRTYAFIATPVLTSIIINEPDASKLQKVGDFYYFTAQTLDQNGNSMEPKPTLTWSVIGSGSINSVGKYVVKELSESETVIATSGNVSDSITFKVPLITGMDEELSRKFKVYPNPATTIISIELPFEKSDMISLRIVDLTGRVMYERSEAFLQKETVDLSDFKPGIYLLMARKGNVSVCKKLIVNK